MNDSRYAPHHRRDTGSKHSVVVSVFLQFFLYLCISFYSCCCISVFLSLVKCLRVYLLLSLFLELSFLIVYVHRLICHMCMSVYT